MNAAHLHLLTTHVPVLGTLFGWLLLAWGLLRRSNELKKTGLGVFVLAAVAAVPAYLSGSPAQELLKGISGVVPETIEQHEELAQVAFTGILILGAAALAGLIWLRRGKPVPRWCALGALALGLLVAVVLGWAANLGGKVRHAEILRAPSAGYGR